MRTKVFIHRPRRAEARVRARTCRGKLSFLLRGEKLKGSFCAGETASGNQWLLIKHRDRFAQTNDVLARHASVLSGVSLEELTPVNVPPRLPRRCWRRQVPPGRCRSNSNRCSLNGRSGPSNPQWAMSQARRLPRDRLCAGRRRTAAIARRGLDLTACFPELAADWRAGPPGR